MMLDIEALRAAHPLPHVVGAVVKLTRRGSEYSACCPLHPDKSPSFTIFDGGKRFHCFGCGAGGDVLDFVGQLHGVGLVDAARMLSGGALPVVHVAALPAPVDDVAKIASARSIWRNAGPAAGTAVETYLRARAISIALPDCVRFARLKHPDTGLFHPCAVFAVADADNAITGVQRVFMADDGKGKLQGVNAKLSLGKIGGGAIRLTPPAAMLALAEGPETALSFLELEGRATWATCGATNLSRVVLPAGVSDVIIAGDRGAAGDRANNEAARTYTERGRRVRILLPLMPHGDFNDELQQEALCVVTN